jgi:hypothetical protein
MLREMDFVERDWAALFWALGSATALFRDLEAPMNDPRDVFLRTQQLLKKIRRRTLMGYAVLFILALSFGSFVFIVPNTLQRIGACLTVAAILYMAYQLYESRCRDLPSETDLSACWNFYRAELERQRDFHRGKLFWLRFVIIIPGYLLFCIGFAIARPELAPILAAIMVCFVALLIVAVPNNLRCSRKYQRQIDELDALPKEL